MSTPKTRVLIAGASIAGPALAHCLPGRDFQVTVVERAPAPRPGGQPVDLRGVAKEVVRRMGLAERVRAARTDTRGVSYVDRHNRRRAELRADMFGGDGLIAEIEILRGDLAEVFYRATEQQVEYLFGDRVAALDEGPDGVDVTFESGARRRFDLVVGADGLHSGLRALVFGPEREYVRDLGHCLAFFTLPNHLGLANWALAYGEPEYNAMVRAIRDNTWAMAILSMPGDHRTVGSLDTAGQKALLRSRLSGMGWEVPRLLSALDHADDFYFDTCSQVLLPRWWRGRVALLGDAAFCASPISGQGTSLAVVGAYLLAGELARADGDHRAAFARYQDRMQPWVAATQKMGRDNTRWFAARNRFERWAQLQAVRVLPRLPGSTRLVQGMLPTRHDPRLPDW